MKRLRNTACATLLFAALTLPSSGNGGGYVHGVKFTGELAPFEPSGVSQVQILDEKLDIRIDDRGADVEVRYLMKNISSSEAKVTFGFPIEANTGFNVVKKPKGDKPWIPTKKDLKTLSKAAATQLAGYVVEIDGKTLKHKDQIEPFAFAADQIGKFQGSEALGGLLGWRISSMEFAEGQSRKITIRYRARHEIKTDAMSNRADNEAPRFRYRLSTGGAWAGPIAKGRVTVTFAGQNTKWCEIKKPVRRFVRPVDTSAKKNTFVWEFKNLEPTLADDIDIVAGPESFEYWIDAIKPGRDMFMRTGDRWQYRHQDFTIVASSTREMGRRPNGSRISYGVGNIFYYKHAGESDKIAAWAEGVDGPGIGESLTLTVNKPKRLDAIAVHPGRWGKQEQFEKFGRPSELEITFNGEHKINAKLRDLNELQTFPINGYTKPIEKIVLVIKGVHQGKENQDATCISDIELHAHLEGKPKMGGAR